eukprot:gene22467-27635_t
MPRDIDDVLTAAGAPHKQRYGEKSGGEYDPYIDTECLSLRDMVKIGARLELAEEQCRLMAPPGGGDREARML